jgi:hypothetical protein
MRPYEWQANAQMAANAGLTEEEISAAANDEPVEGIDEEYVKDPVFDLPLGCSWETRITIDRPR